MKSNPSVFMYVQTILNLRIKVKVLYVPLLRVPNPNRLGRLGALRYNRTDPEHLVPKSFLARQMEMNTTHKSFLKVALGIASTLTLGTTLMAQFPNLAQVQLRARAPHAPVAPSAPQVSLVTDWSHKKLVFSAPKDAEQSKRLQQDPRFMQQHHRRAMIAVKSIADIASSGPRGGEHNHAREIGRRNRSDAPRLDRSAGTKRRRRERAVPCQVQLQHQRDAELHQRLRGLQHQHFVVRGGGLQGRLFERAPSTSVSSGPLPRSVPRS